MQGSESPEGRGSQGQEQDDGLKIGEGLTARAGRLVRARRRAAGLSQEDFAEACGLHRTYVGAIERGEKTMTIETARKVAAALGLTLARFFAELGA